MSFFLPFLFAIVFLVSYPSTGKKNKDWDVIVDGTGYQNARMYINMATDAQHRKVFKFFTFNPRQLHNTYDARDWSMLKDDSKDRDYVELRSQVFDRKSFREHKPCSMES